MYQEINIFILLTIYYFDYKFLKIEVWNKIDLLKEPIKYDEL
jgi:hypothetical protein